jgi:hypothetical protein
MQKLTVEVREVLSEIKDLDESSWRYEISKALLRLPLDYEQ